MCSCGPCGCGISLVHNIKICVLACAQSVDSFIDGDVRNLLVSLVIFTFGFSGYEL